MQDMELITADEMKRFKNLNYEQLMDWQFNLMLDLINKSDEIIHREYKDDIILQQGLSMIRSMVLLNMVNRTMAKRFPDSKMADFIGQQYTQREKPAYDLITEEIDSLKEHFDEVKFTLNQDFENEGRRIDAMDTVNRIATLNLREYEDSLSRIFEEPEKEPVT